ncbi:enoyl-CoA hydratase-related protein [Echinicola jeungdonensis]|uniref:Enoyl-CoA hydratase/isomerase family protein n=1 Tax=Echinicola jeungdonensis TaxID=709343 RepID=A0ABV5J1A9_9BACT|nr:enoyl-CoA hydratase-related protein [Echinicola jeungdonensis]MDN3668430.1 enoyl-CoA hydratase-related protein [Echinicola jeungdonensis]
MEKQVTFEISNRMGYITLNRPEKRNALNAEMVRELGHALDEAEKSGEVKVVVIKAEGKAFCAGADLDYIKQLQDFTYEENLGDSLQLKSLFQRIYQFPKVVIAQIQGHALAGGCGLATVCDFAYAATEVKMGYTEVKIGFIPALVMVFLQRKIGEGRARELLLGGKLISADQAYLYGLVNKVVPKEELENEVKNLGEQLILQNSGTSMKMIKAMLSQVQEMELEDALKYAAVQNAKARETEDCKRGIEAFLNKKSINW